MGCACLREPGFRLALGFIEPGRPAQDLVDLLSVARPEARRPGVRCPTEPQEGTAANALEVWGLACGEALSFALA